MLRFQGIKKKVKKIYPHNKITSLRKSDFSLPKFPLEFRNFQAMTLPNSTLFPAMITNKEIEVMSVNRWGH